MIVAYVTTRRILVAAGIGLILWGYYQLFAIDPEKFYIGKNVAALISSGEVSGKVVGIKNRKALIAVNAATLEVPMYTIFKIENLFVDEFETKRIVTAVFISMLGGFLIWAGFFIF
jgi:hypothetical protein